MVSQFSYYVRDTRSRIAHHWDYARSDSGQALCGYSYRDGIAYEGRDRPRAVCVACQALLPPYQARWWRELAEEQEASIVQLEEQLRARRTENDALCRKVGNQRGHLAALQEALLHAKADARATGRPPVAPSPDALPATATAAVSEVERFKDAYKHPRRLSIVPGGLPASAR